MPNLGRHSPLGSAPHPDFPAPPMLPLMSHPTVNLPWVLPMCPCRSLIQLHPQTVTLLVHRCHHPSLSPLEVTFFCGGSPVTSSQVGACSSMMIFLCGASAVASTHVGPSSPRGRAGQHDQSPCLASFHSSPESKGSTQLSVSDSSPAGIL